MNLSDLVDLTIVAVELQSRSLLQKVVPVCKKYIKEEAVLNVVLWVERQVEMSDSYPDLDYLVEKFPFVTEQVEKIKNENLHATDYYTSKLSDLETQLFNLSLRERLVGLSSALDKEPDKVISIVDRLSKDISARYSKTVQKDTFSLRTRVYDQYKEDSEKAGILLGINPVDDVIRGFKVGTLNTLFGWTGSFKTSLAVSMAYLNVVQYRANFGYISLEIPKKFLKYMVLSRHSLHPKFSGVISPIPYRDMFDGVLSEEQEGHFQLLEEDLCSEEYGDMLIFDSSDFPLADFDKEIDALPVELHGLILDHIQLTGYGGRGGGNDQINAYVKKFHDFTQEYHDHTGLAGVLLAQANRDGWARARKNKGRYDMLAISQANELERSSFSVIPLFTTPQMVDQGVLSVQILKLRGGPVQIEPIQTFLDPRYSLVGDSIEVSLDQITEGLL